MLIRAKIKIGDLVEALGAEQELELSNSTLKVNTPSGYQKVLGVRKTKELPIVKLQTDEYVLRCATEHRVETSEGFKFVAEAKDVLTKSGFQDCSTTPDGTENCYDLQVENTNSYWTNGIHSHNSIFLANWAVQAMKHDHNVLVYTLEIAEERLSMRHDAILTKIPVDELILDVEAIKTKYKIFAKMSKSDMLIKEFPTKAISINQLKSHYEQLKLYEDFEPDIIFVDYAGLLRPTYRVGDNYEDLRSIFEELRGWAVELDIPIVTAAQTNRKSMDDKGGTKEIITQVNVADSLGITQTLDVFMTISQSRTEKEEGLINLYIDKSRNGESSKYIKMNIDYKNFILEELEI